MVYPTQRKMKQCLECHKRISKHAIRCLQCAGKRREATNNSSYKDGRTLKKHYCICGKEISYRATYCHSCKQRGFRNHNFNKSWYSVKGRNNNNYKHGRGNFPYPAEFNRQLKEQIRIRDNYECQLCHIKQKNYKRKLDVHHIDYNKSNLQKNNLITLCNDCNLTANINVDYWYAYFTYLVEKK